MPTDTPRQNMLTESVMLSAAGHTDIGRRRNHNEDAYYCNTTSGVFIVADGMGGRNAGETASKAVVTVLPAILPKVLPSDNHPSPYALKSALAEALHRLSSDLFARSQSMPALAGLGSTVVVLLIRDGTGYVAYAGDSRAYLMRGSRLLQLSQDQTTAAALVRSGHLSPEAVARHPLRHTLEEYIGKEGQLNPGMLFRKLRHGDRWLLCSDGLTKGLPDDRLREFLRQPAGPEELCDTLIAEANAVDGSDNITALVVDVN